MSTPVAPAAVSVRTLTLLVLFGAVFGYVEAVAVVYIRVAYEPIHHHHFPDRQPDDLFPVVPLEEWAREAHPYVRSPGLELGREVGTLLLLALVAALAVEGTTRWFAAFALTFGVWDVIYYLCLRGLIGWPRSLLDWDLLFLVPVPWAGPVLAPVAVAATMIVTGGIFFACERQGRPIVPRPGHWLAVLSGAVLMLMAFCWGWRNILAGGKLGPFPWPLFAAGLGVGAAGFAHAWLTRPRVR